MKKRTVHIDEGDKREFDWGSITWLQSGEFSGSEELTLGEVIIKSGKSNPMHTHANCEEILYLLEGELEHSCGDENPYHLKPGGSICIQRGIPHNAKCISEKDARMVVAYSSAYREMQGE
ncbi:MAG: cupin domain-containing protein [Armatimonadota bacterium]|nr:cupin domain-containing protein [Armatimonadota bacterium]